ncbi:MAG: hypothetical protein IT424_04515 [Pirellulales bacterium]|nr:hypothetical protein [Pirellulales bacterium]
MSVILYAVLLGLPLAALCIAASRMLFRTRPRDRTLTRMILLSLPRLGSLWFLQYHAWNRTERLSYLPLTFLLYPEILLIGNRLTLGQNASGAAVVAFSLLLIASCGCLLAVAHVLGLLLRRLRC